MSRCVAAGGVIADCLSAYLCSPPLFCLAERWQGIDHADGLFPNSYVYSYSSKQGRAGRPGGLAMRA
eukprot:2385390-Pyramimonas_sp.AAC.1